MRRQIQTRVYKSLILVLLFVSTLASYTRADDTFQNDVDDLVKAGLTGAAIMEVDTGKIVASNNLDLLPEECNNLVNSFTNPDGAFGSKFRVAQVEYVTVRAESASVYGKKDATGVIILKTGRYVIIGTHSESMPKEQAVYRVQKLATFFQTNGI